MPAPHADFAVAILLGEELLQALVDVQYDAEQLGALPIGDGVVDGSLYVDLPRVACEAASPDQVKVTFRAWGTLRLAATSEEHEVMLAGRFGVPIKAGQPQAASLPLSFDWSSVDLEQLTSTELTGGAFSPTIRAHLSGQVFHDAMEGYLKLLVLFISTSVPSVPLALLGGINKAPFQKATLRVVDGCVCIGIDVVTAGTGIPIITNGDPNALHDDRRGSSLAVWVNPQACSLLFSDYTAPIVAEAGKYGAQLLLFTASPTIGSIGVLAIISSAPAGSMQVSLSLVPRLTGPGLATQDVLWFEAMNVKVDTQLSAAATYFDVFLGFLTLGITAMLAENFLSTLREEVRFQAVSQLRQHPVQRTFDIGSGRTALHAVIDNVEPENDGLGLRISAKAWKRAGSLIVPASLLVDEILIHPLNVELSLPFAVHAGDPHLRVAWTVRRMDQNAVVTASDGRPRTNTSGRVFELFDLKPFATAPTFNVSCRLYRVQGNTPEELFFDTATIRVEDLLDRTHPYVRWTHIVTVPVIQKMSDGTRLSLGYADELRYSAIHKTKVPGRCRMVSRFSRKVTTTKTPGATFGYLDYLDQLPFPSSALPARRNEVCDYCFYGGPTKTVLLP